MCIYIYTHMYVYVYMYIHICTCMCIYIYIYTHMYVYVCVYVYVYTYTHFKHNHCFVSEIIAKSPYVRYETFRFESNTCAGCNYDTQVLDREGLGCVCKANWEIGGAKRGGLTEEVFDTSSNKLHELSK